MASITVAMAAATLSASEAQESVPTLVKDSPLPEGAGLADTFVADKGISDHAAVIFADDFEAGEPGRGWDETRNPDGDVLTFVDTSRESAPLGRRAVQVTATLGRNTGGGFTKWFESADPLFIRFYTKFDEDCDYVHHFCTLRANKSLQGGDRWSGFGGAGERPKPDERFSTAIEPWGNWRRWPPPGRWNFYSYWHEMQPSPDGKYWGNSFAPDEQPNIQRGQWICVEMMLKHNTPGQPDGEQAYWIDGVLRGHWQGFNWRTTPTLMANAFTLESYVTDRWTKQKMNTVSFDNVVIARNYIGPAGGDVILLNPATGPTRNATEESVEQMEVCQNDNSGSSHEDHTWITFPPFLPSPVDENRTTWMLPVLNRLGHCPAG